MILFAKVESNTSLCFTPVSAFPLFRFPLFFKNIFVFHYPT